MTFEDDESVVCEQCGDAIMPGDTYLTFQEDCFCNSECLKDYLLELHDDEIAEEYIRTGDDKESEYYERNEY